MSDQTNEDYVQQLKDLAQKLSESKSSQSTCPSCGHCPTCGRGGYYSRPYPYYPYQPYITWGGIGQTYTASQYQQAIEDSAKSCE